MAATHITLSGVVPVIPVPFLDDESIDESSLRRTVEYVSKQGLGGMVIPAYASEFYKLSDAERERVVEICLQANQRRIPFVAQANHGSAKVAAELAQRYTAMGADMISFAIPRQFAVLRDDLLQYCGRIADAVSCPIMIQDFNPGGPTLDAATVAELHKRHPNIRYVKLEEAMIMDKVAAVLEASGGRVGVIVGWGGYYMLEAVSAGACGIMPGVPIADLLSRVFQAVAQQQMTRAYDLFGRVLPLIAFGLQNLELSHQLEKNLLVARGLFSSATVRSPKLTMSAIAAAHADLLIQQVMRVFRDEELDLTLGC